MQVPPYWLLKHRCWIEGWWGWGVVELQIRAKVQDFKECLIKKNNIGSSLKLYHTNAVLLSNAGASLSSAEAQVLNYSMMGFGRGGAPNQSQKSGTSRNVWEILNIGSNLKLCHTPAVLLPNAEASLLAAEAQALMRSGCSRAPNLIQSLGLQGMFENFTRTP